MKMDALRALFESLGFEDVETYIQSGNVVFESVEANEGALREEILFGSEVETDWEVGSPVVCRSASHR